MPRIDIKTFPKLIIQIPQAEFPDGIKIAMQGRTVPQAGDARTLQLATNMSSTLGIALPTEQQYSTTIWTESSFKKTLDGNKIAELKAPYDEIFSVVAYAHFKDQKKDDPITISMFTTRQNNAPSGTGTTYNLEGVWATQFTLTKQVIEPNYIAKYAQDVIPINQTITLVTQFVGFFADIISKLLMPSLPTPKAIASKFLGPASAPIQMAIATIAEQYAKVKPTVDQVVTAAQAIAAIAANPAEIVTYIPAIITFLLQYVPQEKLAEIIYEFEGSGS
jgi:hypothetical protein